MKLRLFNFFDGSTEKVWVRN